MDNVEKEVKSNNVEPKKKEENKTKKKIAVSTIIKAIILIVVLVFIIILCRKIIIIKDLQNKVSQYMDLSSYSIKSVTYKGNSISLDECLVNGDRYITSTNLIDEENNNKATNFSDGKTVNLYIESDGAKIAMLDTEAGAPSKKEVMDCLETDSLGEFIYMLFHARISTDICDGKECYRIENLRNSSVLYLADSYTTVYIEKDTGLLVRVINVNLKGENKDLVIDYDYEFNTITDDDIKEPDISEYEMKE